MAEICAAAVPSIFGETLERYPVLFFLLRSIDRRQQTCTWYTSSKKTFSSICHKVVFRLFCFVSLPQSASLFRFCFFLFSVPLEMSLFPSVFVPLPFSLINSMESTSYVLSVRIVFFNFVITGWIFYISSCENPINQSIKGYKYIALGDTGKDPARDVFQVL